MMEGVDRKAPIVIDIEDKVTALAERDTAEARVNLVLRTLNSLIGETSNSATVFHNRTSRSKEIKNKYESYIDLLSIINGKAIDYTKTGILYNIPRHIAKYAKPLPYFMKYASEYYKGLSKFSKAQSNMNRLCQDIERWWKRMRFSVGRGFDYKIMMDDRVGVNPELYDEVEEIYLDFCREMKELAKDQQMIRKYGSSGLSKIDARYFTINWEYYYREYKSKIDKLCKDQKMLANIVVDICYRKHPKKNKKFIWIVATNGVLENLQQVKHDLPKRSNVGEYEYLGSKYILSEYSGELEPSTLKLEEVYEVL